MGERCACHHIRPFCWMQVTKIAQGYLEEPPIFQLFALGLSFVPVLLSSLEALVF